MIRASSLIIHAVDFPVSIESLWPLNGKADTVKIEE